MKKFLIVIMSIVMLACSVAMAACAKASSTAVTIDELIRENYAAEKEAEDDAKGREHIEIPDDAEEIEIEGETWTVIRSIEDFKRKIFNNGEKGLTGSFILANDVDVKRFRPYQFKYFEGRLNGNNYKFYGTEEYGGFGACLFYIMKNAVIENVIFSSSDGFLGEVDQYGFALANVEVLLAYSAEGCTVKNCVNYFQPKNKVVAFGGIIDRAFNCTIENCVNYADLIAAGGIANNVVDCRITNCENYGNLSSRYEGGGIVGVVQYDCLIENCINYGDIIGYRSKGGILGGVYGLRYHPSESKILNRENYTENQIIRGCKNYGNIYVLKENDTDRLEYLDDEDYSDLFSIGGIAGAVAKVENCTNEGNFYGFESFGKGIKVDFSGGVVGVAKEVINCTTTYTIPVQKGRAKNVGEIYGILLNN